MFIDFRERGKGRQGVGVGRERNMDVREKHQLPPVCTPAGDHTHNLGMCPDQESNP